jgi:hypothetical protein
VGKTQQSPRAFEDGRNFYTVKGQSNDGPVHLAGCENKENSAKAGESGDRFPEVRIYEGEGALRHSARGELACLFSRTTRVSYYHSHAPKIRLFVKDVKFLAASGRQ